MAIERLFPTLFYTEKMKGARAPVLIRRLTQDCHRFREDDAHGKKWSQKHYRHGYTSYGSITDLAFRSSNFELLKQWIDLQVKKYAEEMEMDLGMGALTMSSFWINMMGRDCMHSWHLHPLSVISGTFYLQTPKGSGGFRIEDPRLARMMAAPPRPADARRENQRFLGFDPTPGTLFLFESWLKHEVPPHGGARERIRVSFNYEWR